MFLLTNGEMALESQLSIRDHANLGVRDKQGNMASHSTQPSIHTTAPLALDWDGLGGGGGGGASSQVSVLHSL